MSAYNDKEEVFNHDVGEAISVAVEVTYNSDGYILARVVHIIQRFMNITKY